MTEKKVQCILIDPNSSEEVTFDILVSVEGKFDPRTIIYRCPNYDLNDIEATILSQSHSADGHVKIERKVLSAADAVAGIPETAFKIIFSVPLDPCCPKPSARNSGPSSSPDPSSSSHSSAQSSSSSSPAAPPEDECPFRKCAGKECPHHIKDLCSGAADAHGLSAKVLRDLTRYACLEHYLIHNKNPDFLPSDPTLSKSITDMLINGQKAKSHKSIQKCVIAHCLLALHLRYRPNFAFVLIVSDVFLHFWNSTDGLSRRMCTAPKGCFA